MSSKGLSNILVCWTHLLLTRAVLQHFRFRLVQNRYLLRVHTTTRPVYDRTYFLLQNEQFFCVYSIRQNPFSSKNHTKINPKLFWIFYKGHSTAKQATGYQTLCTKEIPTGTGLDPGKPILARHDIVKRQTDNQNCKKYHKKPEKSFCEVSGHFSFGVLLSWFEFPNSLTKTYGGTKVKHAECIARKPIFVPILLLF